ncbi:MAG: DUF6252 family protein [Catalinimonas sp.]
MYKLFPTLLAAFFLLTACGNDDDAASPQLNGTMTAKVDGIDWEANVLAQITEAGPSVVVTASTDNSPEGLSSTIQMNLMNVSSTGTYGLDGTNFSAISTASYAFTTGSTANDVSTFNSLGESGTVRITTFDSNKIEGTFQFVGAEVQGSAKRTITDGAFSINR